MNQPAARPVTPELVAEARHLVLAEGGTLVQCLQRLAQLPPEVFVGELARAFDYPQATMERLHAMEARFDWIGYADCVQRGVASGTGADGEPCLIIADPFDAAGEAWALARVPASAKVMLAHADDLSAFLAQQEERLRAMQDMDGLIGEVESSEVVETISLARINDDTSPVVRLVNSTIYDALKMQASDIHLECDAGSLLIKYRIDGVLVQVGQVKGAETAEQVISRVKVMAELDIAERRVPQDGRFKVRISGREIDFRVSVMPSIFGEDAVLRLLDRRALTAEAETLRLNNLGLDDGSIATIRRLAAKPHGMLLVTGPTGSGKTTTLYAAITEIHSGRDKIVTIEDPVEYRLPRVLQIPVNEKKGLTFARGLRSILRHDPDKIMVGEIRDDETAQIAVQSALTGHLVFTTVHANNVFDVLGRFLHMGVDPYSFAAALNGIVAQRLLRVNCEHCSATVQPSAEECEEAGVSSDATKTWTFRSGAGCGHCRGTGYRGRRAVAEVLVMNDRLREMIAAKAPISALRAAATEAGMRPLREAALHWVAAGETTLAEVSRVAG